MPNENQPSRVTLFYHVQQIEHESGEFDSGARGYKRWEAKGTVGLTFELPEGQERLLDCLALSVAGDGWLLSDVEGEESDVFPDDVTDEGGGGSTGGTVHTEDGELTDEEIDCDEGEVVVVRRQAAEPPYQIEMDQSGRSKKFSTVAELLRWIAERGDSVAMRILADSLLSNESSDEAISWLSRAADLGDLDARTELGRLYLHGDDVGEDLEKARQHLEAAVSRDHPKAFAWLGDLESKVEGDGSDLARAIYERGAGLGDPISQYRFGALLIEESSTKKAAKRGADLVKKAADWGLHMAMLLRAEHLLEGEFVKKDEAEAKSVLEEAADDGCVEACTKLGEIWDFLGDEKDFDEAQHWYERGVDMDCPRAHWRLADLLMRTEEEGEHKSRRYALYLFAAENCVDQARRNLEFLHKEGFGNPEERERFENLPPEED